jgi:PAS domain S-box-containing protein
MKAAESTEAQTEATKRVETLPRRVLSVASRVHGYFPALAAFGVAILLHYVILYLFSPKFPGILVIYTAAMLFGAWCGYGPGILVVVLAASVVPYLSNPDFSLNQIDPGGLAALVLLSVLVSRMAEGRRRRETLLLDVNAELDRRVQAQTAELERTNRSLEHQVAELETLYAKSPVGLSLLDKDLRFVRINEKLASINGSSVSDHQGRRLHEMVPKPIADVIGPLFRSVLETGAPILNYELQGLSSQPGAKRDWLIDCARVIAEDGSVIGLQIVVQDITERKRGENALAQANDELRQSEEQFRLLANAIPQLCWMANADGWIFWYNDRWYEYTGLTPARLAGWG